MCRDLEDLEEIEPQVSVGVFGLCHMTGSQVALMIGDDGSWFPKLTFHQDHLDDLKIMIEASIHYRDKQIRKHKERQI